MGGAAGSEKGSERSQAKLGDSNTCTDWGEKWDSDVAQMPQEVVVSRNGTKEVLVGN